MSFLFWWFNQWTSVISSNAYSLTEYFQVCDISKTLFDNNLIYSFRIYLLNIYKIQSFFPDICFFPLKSSHFCNNGGYGTDIGCKSTSVHLRWLHVAETTIVFLDADISWNPKSNHEDIYIFLWNKYSMNGLEIKIKMLGTLAHAYNLNSGDRGRRIIPRLRPSSST